MHAETVFPHMRHAKGKRAELFRHCCGQAEESVAGSLQRVCGRRRPCERPTCRGMGLRLSNSGLCSRVVQNTRGLHPFLRHPPTRRRIQRLTNTSLIETNRRRSRNEFEYELLDTASSMKNATSTASSSMPKPVRKTFWCGHSCQPGAGRG